jgi:hypothetical protein
MGQVIYLLERAPVTKNRRALRAHQERERAMTHARMMMVGALVTTSLMMSAVAVLFLAQ